MTGAATLRNALLARRRQLINRLAAGADVTGFADAGLVKMLAETQTAIAALQADDAEAR